ncbi:MAG: hypothetical protein JXR77_19045, partial [Lentisphaeria bacterium]|nr:hypothetical protein [Lentisphaeria bacterium]
PRDGATVVLRYGTPDGLEPRVTSPALVVGGYGRGRVAVLTCPVDWGSPPQWCLWSRLGEYHRKLLVQTALWACGRDE